MDGDQKEETDSWLSEKTENSDDKNDKSKKAMEDSQATHKRNKNKQNCSRRRYVPIINKGDTKEDQYNLRPLLFGFKPGEFDNHTVLKLAKSTQTDPMKEGDWVNTLVLVKGLETRIDSIASDIKDIREHTDGMQRQQRNQVLLAVNTETEENDVYLAQTRKPRTENRLEEEENATSVEEASVTGQTTTGHEEAKAVTNEQIDREREIEDICVRVVNRVLAIGQYQQIHQQTHGNDELSSSSEELNQACASPPPQNSNLNSFQVSCCSCKKCSCFCHSNNRMKEVKCRRNRRSFFDDSAMRKERNNGWKRKPGHVRSGEDIDENVHTSPATKDSNRMKEVKGKRNTRSFFDDRTQRKQRNNGWKRKTGQVSFREDADKGFDPGFDSLTYSNSRQEESNSSAGNEQHSCTEEPESLVFGGHLLYPRYGPEPEGLKEKTFEKDEEEIGHVHTSLVTKDSKRCGLDGRTDNVDANHPIISIVPDSDVPKEEWNGSLKKDISDRNQSPNDQQYAACGGEPEYPSDDSDSEDDFKKGRAKDDRLSIDRKQYGDGWSSDNLKWRIDTDVWKRCVEIENVDEATRLVKNGILPDQDLLDRASEVFGINSDTIHNICTAICCYVKEHLLHVIRVWPAVDYRNEGNEKQIIFIIYTSQSSEIETTDYRCYKRSANEISTSCVDENRKIKELEENFPKDYSETEQIRECLNKHSKPLMEQHTNLTRVFISWFKSTGYGTKEQSITPKICIAVYVQVKGLLPLNEDVLPKVIDGFDVDVREGVVMSYAGPNEHHEQLKMGCAVHCGLKDGQGKPLGGTLGGFFEVGKDMYCISSAHIFLSAEDMGAIKDRGFYDLRNDTRIKSFKAFQPVVDGARPFGVGVRAVYKEGGNGETGAEAVIIKVLDRFPISGEFPDCPHRRNPGFERPNFSSGKMCNREEVNRLIRNKKTDGCEIRLFVGLDKRDFSI